MKWNNVKDKLPESGQQVLTYYYEQIVDEDGIDQCGIFTYHKAGDTLENEMPYVERLEVMKTKSNHFEKLAALLFETRNILAVKDGFYMCDTNKEGLMEWRRHNDQITHWRAFPTRGEVNGD